MPLYLLDMALVIFFDVQLRFFSDFRFDFWSVWLHERLISTVLDLKNFRIFDLIVGVFDDSTRGCFPSCWTWKIFVFWIWFLESITPREADFHLKKFSDFKFDFGVFDTTRGWFPPCWTWKYFGFSIWFLESMTPREADFHRVGLENISDFQFDFWNLWRHERLIPAWKIFGF